MDTIFALSSGAPPCAVAVIRISGPAAHGVLLQIAGPLPPPRMLTLRTIRDPLSGEALDRALVAQFPAKGSVSGEPMAELHLHGGRATVEAVERMLENIASVRRARAGEFTWRAFSNGKLNLVQVESLSDLLRSETEAQRRAAVAGDGLSQLVEAWRRQLLLLSALVEARLDQSDEGDVPQDGAQIAQQASQIIAELGEVLERPGAERLFAGVRVVFAGPPNAGKSTLLNAIAQREVAITSPIAGTTRDVIEAPVQMGGVAFVLTDTAGLRASSDDLIEQQGIARATRRIEDADIVIWMGDDPAPETVAGQIIAIHARADMPGREAFPAGRLAVAAATGAGVAVLTDQIIACAATLLPRVGDVALTRRQRSCLSVCHSELRQFAALEDDVAGAEHLRRCRSAFDELTGRSGTEEMLDALFSTFCIGK